MNADLIEYAQPVNSLISRYALGKKEKRKLQVAKQFKFEERIPCNSGHHFYVSKAEYKHAKGDVKDDTVDMKN